jgi:hypothetical protein
MVSILCQDLVDSTTLAQRLDPKAVRALTARTPV